MAMLALSIFTSVIKISVRKYKFRVYKHITRLTGLAKGEGKIIHKKRLEDSIREWTGLKLGEALRKAENRKGYKSGDAPSVIETNAK